jgi:hypothetical protein
MLYYREWIDIEFHGWQNKSSYFSVRKKDGSEAAIFHWKRQMLSLNGGKCYLALIGCGWVNYV